MYTLKIFTRLHEAVMMIKDCELLIKLQHIHTDTSTKKACNNKI